MAPWIQKMLQISHHPWRMMFWGAAAALAWPPFGIPVILVFSLTALLIQIWRATSLKEAFWQSFYWHWSLKIVSLSWIGQSLFIEPWKFGWLWPFCVFGISGVLACYWAFLSMILWKGKHYIWKAPLPFGLTFVWAWSLAEKLQAVLFTGFPWNPTAHIGYRFLWFSQGVSFLGTSAWSVVSVVLIALPGVFFLWKQEKGWKHGWMILGAALLGVSMIGGLRCARHVPSWQEGVFLRLVQPNIPQAQKNDPAFFQQQCQILDRLSTLPSKQGNMTHIIWPEGALPWCWQEKTLEYMPTLPFFLGKLPVLTGATYAQGDVLLNGLFFLEPQKRSTMIYSKKHLVPFGEYVPLRSFLKKWVPLVLLKKITPGDMDFVPGHLPRVSVVKGLPPFLSMVCYESIFPVLYQDIQNRHPSWILTITNDAWFGASHGPYQHLIHSMFRALETGLPVVRVANTGISALYDGTGTLQCWLPLNTEGVLDVRLPRPLPCYGKWHQAAYWSLMMVLAFGSLGSWMLRRSKMLLLIFAAYSGVFCNV